MKQVVQNYRTGKLWLEDVPDPICRANGVLVRNEFSVVSTGTERMKVDQARMSLVKKAQARPDQVKQVLQSVRQAGLVDTVAKVQERLDALTTLGYSSVGIVEEVGANIDHIKPGDRVVCAGEGIACHAELVFVPKNFCAVVPEGVEPREAAFATIGAIAMNGVRQASVALGDTVVVIGLGLVGLLAVQLLKAAGCRVIGVDIADAKLELARTCGADFSIAANDPSLPGIIENATAGRGADAVYIAASSKSSDPMDLAGEVCRDRATIVIVGMIPIQADWRSYYAKELKIVMSRSYGPGRYDRDFETKGVNYPVGYVPWTQQRNLEEFVRLVGTGVVTPTQFGAEEFDFEMAPDAYEKLHAEPGRYSGGVLFRYRQLDIRRNERTLKLKKATRGKAHAGAVSIGLIGAGNFATGTLIPALKKCANAHLHTVCSAGGLNAKAAASRHGFEYACSSIDDVFSNDEIDAVVIATRHDTHAKFAMDALRAGKHAFVEKPLALSEDDLDALFECAVDAKRVLMPGFNRRFSPLARAVRDHFSNDAGPLQGIVRVNAGSIDGTSWYQDVDEGGWRIVSEGCHWVDLLSYLLDAYPTSVSALMTGGSTEGQQNDNCIANIEFSSGSIATLGYFANGDPGFEKERIEIFGQGKVASIDNWHSASLRSGGATRKVRPKGSGKGHAGEMENFIAAIRNDAEPLISLESAFRTTLTMLRIQESMLQSGIRKAVDA